MRKEFKVLLTLMIVILLTLAGLNTACKKCIENRVEEAQETHKAFIFKENIKDYGLFGKQVSGYCVDEGGIYKIHYTIGF